MGCSEALCTRLSCGRSARHEPCGYSTSWPHHHPVMYMYLCVAGWCIFNDLAVAAKAAQRDAGELHMPYRAVTAVTFQSILGARTTLLWLALWQNMSEQCACPSSR
jgi:hypothetical protein